MEEDYRVQQSPGYLIVSRYSRQRDKSRGNLVEGTPGDISEERAVAHQCYWIQDVCRIIVCPQLPFHSLTKA
jgi:hypothetical protein